MEADHVCFKLRPEFLWADEIQVAHLALSRMVHEGLEGEVGTGYIGRTDAGGLGLLSSARTFGSGFTMGPSRSMSSHRRSPDGRHRLVRPQWQACHRPESP